jgi:hypothetical protein
MADDKLYTITRGGVTKQVPEKWLGQAFAKGWLPDRKALAADPSYQDALRKQTMAASTPPSRLAQTISEGASLAGGIETGLSNVAKVPGQYYHAFIDPARPGREQALQKKYGLGNFGMAGYRIALEPLEQMKEMSHKAYAEAERTGAKADFSRGAGYQLASLLPIFGPMAASLGETAGTGNGLGAAGEGLVYAALPKVGRLAMTPFVKSLGPTTTSVEGIPVPSLRSEFAPGTLAGSLVEKTRARGIGRDYFEQFEDARRTAVNQALLINAQSTVEQINAESVLNEPAPGEEAAMNRLRKVWKREPTPEEVREYRLKHREYTGAPTLTPQSMPGEPYRQAAGIYEAAAKPLYTVLDYAIGEHPEIGKVFVAKTSSLLNKFFADNKIDVVRNPKTGEIMEGLDTVMRKLKPGMEAQAGPDLLMQVRSEIGKAIDKATDPNLQRKLHILQDDVDQAIEQGLAEIDKTPYGMARTMGAEYKGTVDPYTYEAPTPPAAPEPAKAAPVAEPPTAKPPDMYALQDRISMIRDAMWEHNKGLREAEARGDQAEIDRYNRIIEQDQAQLVRAIHDRAKATADLAKPGGPKSVQAAIKNMQDALDAAQDKLAEEQADPTKVAAAARTRELIQHYSNMLARLQGSGRGVEVGANVARLRDAAPPLTYNMAAIMNEGAEIMRSLMRDVQRAIANGDVEAYNDAIEEMTRVGNIQSFLRGRQGPITKPTAPEPSAPAAPAPQAPAQTQTTTVPGYSEFRDIGTGSDFTVPEATPESVSEGIGRKRAEAEGKIRYRIGMQSPAASLVDTWRLAKTYYNKRSVLVELFELFDSATKGTPLEAQGRIQGPRAPHLQGERLVKGLRDMSQPRGGLTTPEPSRLEQLFGSTPAGKAHILYLRQAAELIARAQETGGVGRGMYPHSYIGSAISSLGGRRLAQAMTTPEGARGVLSLLTARNTTAFQKAMAVVTRAAMQNAHKRLDELESKPVANLQLSYPPVKQAPTAKPAGKPATKPPAQPQPTRPRYQPPPWFWNPGMLGR